MTGIALYDMDRTITRRGTWTPWLIFWARRNAPWRLALLPLLAGAALAYAMKLIPRGRLKEFGHRLLMGRDVSGTTLDRTARAYADQVLAAEVFPGAVAQIAADRTEGRRIVIATASNAYYARAIAAALGVADVIATESVWDGDVLSARLAGPNCYGAAKLAAVEAWLAREGLGAEPLRFYSDHISDLPVFERADEPVAANPSPALRALAVARGWRVVDWGTVKAGWFERA